MRKSALSFAACQENSELPALECGPLLTHDSGNSIL